MRTSLFSKILLILSLFVMAFTFGQMSNIDTAAVKQLLTDGVVVAGGIMDVGFKAWIKGNWGVAIAALVGLFSIIASITPNKNDNKILGLLLKAVNLFGFNVGKAKNATDSAK